MPLGPAEWSGCGRNCPIWQRRLRRRACAIRTLCPGEDDAGSGQGRSWRSTLGVETREGAEARLSDLGYGWEWRKDGSLRVTTPRLDAVRDLGGGRRSFFNQLIAAYRGWSDSRNDGRSLDLLCDGSAIDPQAMGRAIALADELTYDHAWQAGDVVLVDNFITCMGGGRSGVSAVYCFAVRLRKWLRQVFAHRGLQHGVPAFPRPAHFREVGGLGNTLWRLAADDGNGMCRMRRNPGIAGERAAHAEFRRYLIESGSSLAFIGRFGACNPPAA